ncbi:hypothetical protein C5Z25_00070 [Lactobacillus sp. CBA3605]|uniref:hypothetical protein n=1 Tax=Lactobacillus sp. CBA3605 TaxID=2099788 RepID=UPI000CFB5B47|nr:hypothetical protein [Lactobacillus sp. CBA3605]AVK60264.1 hypothetical protein C5Z25_00070 [Lactobacillus sp. CBA3605]
MNKVKLSFNKKSVADITSVIFIVASGIVTLGTALGYTLPGATSDTINAWVSAITLILGSGGLLRNTANKGDGLKDEVQK